MILLLEIALLIWGIGTLIKGRFGVGSNRVVRGIPARVVGVFLLAPLPLALATGFTLGFIWAIQGRQPDDDEIQATAVIAELSILFGCVVVALLIAYWTARPIREMPSADTEEEEPYSAS